MYRGWIKLLLAVIACTTLSGCGEPAQDKIALAKALFKEDVQLKPGPVDADAPEEFTTTASGLKYRIRRKSDGRKPTVDDTVKIQYRGQFDDGKIFDSSYGKSGHAVELPMKVGIPGWVEGLQLIGEGGMIELEIPPGLGYGKHGHGHSVPPDATLHFIVELLKVK